MHVLQSIPSQEHEERVEVLHDLAIMMGFSVPLISLPDGARPDVFRFAQNTKGIFIGEAKATERPTCMPTKVRYANYIRWLSMSRGNVSSSVCAICFSDRADAQQWVGFIIDALRPFQIQAAHIAISSLDYPTGLVYATLRDDCFPSVR